MIKKGLKNFFSNLKYYFTPLGVLALGVIIGLAIAIPVSRDAVHGLFDYVTSLENVELDFSAFLHKILDAVLAQDWEHPAKAITTIFNSEWLAATFRESIFALTQNVGVTAEQIVEQISACVSTIVVSLVVVLIFALIGIVSGFFLTRSFIRREIAKRPFWKGLLVSIIDAAVTVALPLLAVYLSSLWEPSIYLVMIFLPMLWSVVLLLEAFAVQGAGKIKAKEVINFKTSAKLLLTNLLIMLIASLIASAISAAAGEILGLVLGLPFLEIAVIVSALNAEAYVKDLAERTQEHPQLPLAA